MPGSNQLAVGTASFNATVTSMKERVAALLEIDATTIRVVAVPDNMLSEYLSQQGVLFRVRSAEPEPMSGGGRHDYRVSRIVDVVVLTENLQDPGGRDDVAVAAHIVREELLVNALHDQPPPTALNNNAIRITIKWIPGGADIARQVKADYGMFVSVLPFQIKYRAPLTVFRETD